MLFERKIKTVGSISEFMGNKEKEGRAMAKALSAITGTTIPFIIGAPAYAHEKAVQVATRPEAFTGKDMQGDIMVMFDPLIDLVQALAYPIAGVMLAGGCLYIMIVFKEKGMDMLKNAGIGYILVMLSPLFLKILVQVGTKIMA